MTAVILHLSDIHIKTAQDLILKRSADIAVCVYSSLPTASQVFIVLSGDIAYSGTATQYNFANTFLRNIRETIQNEKNIPVTFIIVPGNHDCDFSLNSGARKSLVKSLEGDEPLEVDESIVKICTEIQKPFFEFREGLESNSKAKDDQLWRTSQFDVEGTVIGFECLNIAWVSKINEDPGRLFFPVDRYIGRVVNNVDVRLVILHHPLNWFNQSIYRSFRMFIRQIATIIFSGHEHQGNVGEIHEAETDKSIFVEGCTLQGKEDLSDSSFNIVILDLNIGQFLSVRYAWNGDRYLATKEGSWLDYHKLPSKKSNPFPLADSFQKMLDDPGAFLKHPSTTNIALSDIFIYPDLRKIGNYDDKRQGFVSSKILLSPDVISNGVIIEGEEKSGCTSLLFQLYREYHDRGFIPVLIQGKDLRKTTDNEIDILIKRAIEVQYGKDRVSIFEQTSLSKKILLLDDFDESPIKAENLRVDLLCALKNRFKNLIVTAGEIFSIREMLDGNFSHQLFKFDHYQIQPFNYARRFQLIERWFLLDTDVTIDEAKFIARCDQAEKLMNSVMIKPVIPSFPLYLLTLLQSIEAGRTGDFKESALGYYYQYLLTEAFRNSGVKPESLTEIFQYSAHLAWEFNSRQRKELSEIELRDFNSRFSKSWVTVDFFPRVELLIAARVLCRVGDDYAFRYPYIYYYLKGKYLSEKLNDIEIRAYIKHCARHLYVRDYANTVLFLAHHTNDDYVLNTIEESLCGLFRGHAYVTFDGDIKEIEKLVEDTPKLLYSGEPPKEYRKRRNKLRDDLDDGDDGLAETEEESEELSRMAKMTMLFKTIEIFGQVLKNQYSKILRVRKVNLIEELFKGPLRAARVFFDYFERNPNALVAKIEVVLQKRGNIEKEEDRKNIARKIIANLLQWISFAFVMKAAQAATSDSLEENIREVVKRNGTLAFKLIELCIYLDSPKPIPKRKLEQLYKEVDKNLVAERILHLMVLNRLYMFKTNEQDMQWISEKLKIDIGTQHAITYQENRRRRLK